MQRSYFRRTAKQFLEKLGMKKTISHLLETMGLKAGEFRGAFPSHRDAMNSVRRNKLAGYDNSEVADVAYEFMSSIIFWDWPVLYWLYRLSSESKTVIDAGGHMGTKYRAFRNHLPDDGLRWIVYDLPAIVRRGRELAAKDGLEKLEFIDQLNQSPPPDVFLGSGLLQYLDIPFHQLIRQLPVLPRHIVLNKVATHHQSTVFTLQNLGIAEVPYQIRNHEEFLRELNDIGYEVIDHWEISELSHTIKSRGRTYVSTSHGFYARLRD